MFEPISVSERTRKPWTVAMSCAGQCVMIGLLVLVPLVTNQALPHGRFAGFLLPEPPAPMPVRGGVQPTHPHAKPIPFQLNPRGLQEPRKIPTLVAMIDDPDFVPVTGNGIAAVPFGMGPASGSGNGAIDGIARAMPRPERPAPSVAKDPPAQPRRISVVSRLQTAKLVSGPRPAYPPLAKAARVSGEVRLRAVIARDGTIMELRVFSGHPLLIPAALAAVKQWVFQPTYLNGDAVEVATEIVVVFTLQQ